jgi:nucleotide-binding universal stress UspA family protein
MKKIVIATDGSPSAREAIDFGLGLACELDTAVVFAHVASGYEVLTADRFGESRLRPHELSNADREPLEEAAALALSRGVRATTELLVGDPADEIVAYADSVDADAIVVGCRGRGSVAGALLGSVSQRILSDARRPVLVVPQAVPRGDSAPPT